MTLTTHHLGHGPVASRARAVVAVVSPVTGRPRQAATWLDVAGEVCPEFGPIGTAIDGTTDDVTTGGMTREPSARLLEELST